MLELGALMLKLEAHTNAMKLNPPNFKIVFLSRFKSHRPENVTAFWPQQPTLIRTPTFDLRGPIAGF
jgi:hypothetical protein